MKPAALYIVAHAPDRSARQAGQKTAQMYLDKLSMEYRVDTIILCSATPDELQGASRCPGTIRIMSFGRLRKFASILTGLVRGVPPRFATRISARIARDVAGLVRARRYELVWLEFSQVGWLLPVIVKSAHDAVRTVLSLHDIQTELVHRKSAVERVVFGWWTREYERKLLLMADSVRVLSNKDEDLIRNLAGSQLDTRVTAPALSDFVRLVNRSVDKVEAYSMLFWGAMNRIENYSSALWFARRIFPLIAQRFPATTLYVVGSNPPRQLRAIASERIIVTGFVEDPTSYFIRASLGIVPLREGAGIKLKTLEMLEAGLTVISTPIGAEGIAPSERLVVVELQEMADSIIDIWSNSSQTI